MVITPNLVLPSTDDLYDQIGQEEILQMYTGSRRTGVSLSRIRTDDNKSSFSVYYHGTTLFWKDWGKPGWQGDMVELVRKKFYYATREEAIKKILSDFPNRVIPKYNTVKLNSPKEPNRSLIKPLYREWNNHTDKFFWTQYGLNLATLKRYNVNPINAFTMRTPNGEFTKTLHGSPVYCYYNGIVNGIKRYQVYMPYNKDKRFYTNLPINTVHGWMQLPETGDILIITKSLKDVMVIDSLFKYPAVSPPAESIVIQENIIKHLKGRFKHIYSLMDFDKTGVFNANQMRHLYGIKPLFLTNGRFNTKDFGAKDSSDFVKANGVEESLKLFNEWKLYKRNQDTSFLL